MTLRLGFFPQFKGSDTVLLHGAAADILDISERIAAAISTPNGAFPVHRVAVVAPRHPVQLFVAASPAFAPVGFVWSCTPAELPGLQASLTAVANACPAHQYFDLVNTSAKFIVAAGEYDDAWWLRQS